MSEEKKTPTPPSNPSPAPGNDGVAERKANPSSPPEGTVLANAPKNDRVLFKGIPLKK